MSCSEVHRQFAVPRASGYITSTSTAGPDPTNTGIRASTRFCDASFDERQTERGFVHFNLESAWLYIAGVPRQNRPRRLRCGNGITRVKCPKCPKSNHHPTRPPASFLRNQTCTSIVGTSFGDAAQVESRMWVTTQALDMNNRHRCQTS